MRRRVRKRQKGEDKRPILKRLSAALLRSFRGSTAKKGFVWGSAQGNWDSSEKPTAISIQPNGVGEGTTTLRRLLIGAVQFCSLYMYIQQKFRTSLFRKTGINTCFGNGQKVCIDD